MGKEGEQVNAFLVDNFVKLKLGTLDEEKVQRLEELGDDWQQHAEDLICEAALAKILRTDSEASNQENTWEIAVQIVANRINEDIRAMATA